ncbi:Zinc finger BED domain-containing protein RICESLEEPER 2 [Linum grandiflorum]
MIVLHEYPLAIVDHFYFRKFLHIIQPLFKCPTRNTVKSDILKMYKSELENLRNVLEDIDSRVAITSDMWTASHQKKGYMAITVHFIDNKWNMRHYIIRFCYVPCPHTAEALAAAIYKVLFEWNLDRKLSTVTLDNCSTNDLLVDKLKDKLNPDNLIRSGSLLHMRCCAHILNLIVKDGLDVVKSSVEIIRESVGFWTATPKRMEKFEEAARHLRIPTDKKLCLDCPTRWNSTYLMLNVALIYKDVFYRLKSRDPRYKTSPTENDWWFAKEICGKLQVFYEVTELFSGSNYPTSNLFFAKICDVKVSLKTWAADSHPFVSQMAVKMIEKFDKYWSVIHNVLSVAAVLDPRYKMALLNFYFPLVYGTNSSSELFKVRKLLEDLVNDYKDKSAGKEDAMPIDDNSSSEVTGGRMTEYDKFVDILLASSDSGKNELDTYLEDKVLRRSVDFDILNWWKANSTKYPTLSLIARDVLAIPISTVASESAFSAGGRLISAQRSRLHVKTVEALMCTQSWLLDQVEKGNFLAYFKSFVCTV